MVYLPLVLAASGSTGIKLSRLEARSSIVSSVRLPPSFTLVSRGRSPSTLYPFDYLPPPFFLIPLPNNLSTSLPSVHLRTSCLLPLDLSFCASPPLPLFSGCSIFSSPTFLAPLCPLGRLKACYCLALPYAVWTTSGSPTDSMSIGETLIGLYHNLFLCFFLAVALASGSTLRWSLAFDHFSLFSAPFLLVSGGVTRWVTGHTITLHRIPLDHPHLIHSTPLPRLPPLHPPRGPPTLCTSSGRTYLLATYPPTLLYTSPPIDSWFSLRFWVMTVTSLVDTWCMTIRYTYLYAYTYTPLHADKTYRKPKNKQQQDTLMVRAGERRNTEMRKHEFLIVSESSLLFVSQKTGASAIDRSR